MIEMRWLVPVEGEKRLQYRQQVDKTIYAHAVTNLHRNMQWSEWRDVPLVAEPDPSYP